MRTTVNVNFGGTRDAFEESKHKRNHGQFASSGGSGEKLKRGQTGSHKVDGLPYTTHQTASQKKNGTEIVHRYGSQVGAVSTASGGGYHAIETKNDGKNVLHGIHATRETALKKVHEVTGGAEHAKAHKENR